MSDADISREFNGISTLNGFSILGIGMPFIGLICAPLAHGRATRLHNTLKEDQKERYLKQIRHSWSVSNILTIVSVISVFVWWGVISSNNSQIQQRQTTITNNQASLQTCISQNVTPLQDDSRVDPYMATQYSQEAQTALAACQTQYPTN